MCEETLTNLTKMTTYRTKNSWKSILQCRLVQIANLGTFKKISSTFRGKHYIFWIISSIIIHVVKLLGEPASFFHLPRISVLDNTETRFTFVTKVGRTAVCRWAMLRPYAAWVELRIWSCRHALCTTWTPILQTSRKFFDFAGWNKLCSQRAFV